MAKPVSKLYASKWSSKKHARHGSSAYKKSLLKVVPKAEKPPRNWQALNSVWIKMLRLFMLYKKYIKI